MRGGAAYAGLCLSPCGRESDFNILAEQGEARLRCQVLEIASEGLGMVDWDQPLSWIFYDLASLMRFALLR